MVTPKQYHYLGSQYRLSYGDCGLELQRLDPIRNKDTGAVSHKFVVFGFYPSIEWLRNTAKVYVGYMKEKSIIKSNSWATGAGAHAEVMVEVLAELDKCTELKTAEAELKAFYNTASKIRHAAGTEALAKHKKAKKEKEHA